MLMRDDYKDWLKGEGYGDNTVSTQLSHARRLEEKYGDLKENYERDGMQSILSTLRYTADDARRNVPNPSKLTIKGDLGKALASYRSAVNYYRRFMGARNQATLRPIETEEAPSNLRVAQADRLGLERDLQRVLRREIAQLDPALRIIDDGVERSVASGFIDILAEDESGIPVVIELKAGVPGRTAIGQILSYMGDIADDSGAQAVRGILVAHDFDMSARSAARMVNGLELRAYSVAFTFREPGPAAL